MSQTGTQIEEQLWQRRLERIRKRRPRATAPTPNHPLAHTALSISLPHAGHLPEEEAGAARAHVLEWQVQLQFSPEKDFAV